MSAHLVSLPHDDTTPRLVNDTRSTRRGLLGIRTRARAGAWTLSLEGELDLSTAQLLEDDLRRAESASPTSIEIDLRHLTFMDSSGVRVVESAMRRLEPATALTLVRGSRAVQRVFALTGTENELPFVEAPPAAA